LLNAALGLIGELIIFISIYQSIHKSIGTVKYNLSFTVYISNNNNSVSACLKFEKHCPCLCDLRVIVIDLSNNMLVIETDDIAGHSAQSPQIALDASGNAITVWMQ
jgi:hypothetical protein